MAKIKRKKRVKVKEKKSTFINYWKKPNFYILFAGIATLFIGYFLMAQSPWNNPLSLTVSPIVLLIAYIVIFPLSILYKKKKKIKAEENNVPRQN